jgi:hypothetical protein
MMFFRNIHTGKRYRVVRLDRAQNTVILRGETQEFSVPYDLDLIERCGYSLEESTDA